MNAKSFHLVFKMKKGFSLFVFLSISTYVMLGRTLPPMPLAPDPNTPREWTAKTGGYSVYAICQGVDESGNIVLRRVTDKVQITVPLSMFSDEDQAYIGKLWTKPKAVTADGTPAQPLPGSTDYRAEKIQAVIDAFLAYPGNERNSPFTDNSPAFEDFYKKYAGLFKMANPQTVARVVEMIQTQVDRDKAQFQAAILAYRGSVSSHSFDERPSDVILARNGLGFLTKFVTPLVSRLKAFE